MQSSDLSNNHLCTMDALVGQRIVGAPYVDASVQQTPSRCDGANGSAPATQVVSQPPPTPTTRDKVRCLPVLTVSVTCQSGTQSTDAAADRWHCGGRDRARRQPHGHSPPPGMSRSSDLTLTYNRHRHCVHGGRPLLWAACPRLPPTRHQIQRPLRHLQKSSCSQTAPPFAWRTNKTGPCRCSIAVAVHGFHNFRHIHTVNVLLCTHGCSRHARPRFLSSISSNARRLTSSASFLTLNCASSFSRSCNKNKC